MLLLIIISSFKHLPLKNWAIAFLCVISYNVGFSQVDEMENLQSKNYDELQIIFDDLPSDSLTKKENVAAIYLSKAKKNRDTISIGRAYYLYSALNESNIISKEYADSIITVTKNIYHESFPALGYFLKGYWCYESDEYQEALHNYLIGDSIAKERKNVKQYISNRSMIAQLKNRAGDYRGALKIYLTEIDSLNLIKDNNPSYQSHFVNRLYNASLTYMHLKLLDSAKLYSEKGLKESVKVKDSSAYYDFVYNIGVIDFLSGNNQIAEININKALPYLDDYSKAMAYYYKGEIVKQDLSDKEVLSYFEISDSIAEKIKYTFPELRNVYEYTIGYYEAKKDLSNQLVYVNKLLKLDSTLTHSKDLQLEISKKYDRPILLNKKEKIIDGLKNKNRTRNFVIGIFIIITLILLFSVYFYWKRQMLYQKKFNELVFDNSQTINPGDSDSPQSNEVMPVEIYNIIAMGLNEFENKNEFLAPITLVELAKKLDTNTTYLSKYINIKTSNNFSQYLNRLRVEYAIEKLKTDSRLRSFTIKAIAEEIGFGTAQSFSKAFYQETGIYPSYYIKKLSND